MMSSFFGFTRSKKATTTTAVPSAASTRMQVPTAIGENFAAPAAKAVAVEKPGHAGPIRRTLVDITNASRQVPAQGATKALKPAAQQQQHQQLHASSRRPDMVLSSIRQSAATAALFPATASTAVAAGGAVVPRLTQLPVPAATAASTAAPVEAEPMIVDGVAVAAAASSASAVVDINAVQAPARTAAVSTAPPEDIDAYDAEDPMFASEYVNDIYEYLRQKEVSDRVNPAYMSRQRHVSDKMRAVVVNWLAENHLKLRLLTETLFLAVNVMDKFLERRAVTPQQLELLGFTALLIASKCEEIYSIEINDLILVSQQEFTHRDFVLFERIVLTSIEWAVTSPSPLHFLRRFSKAAKNDGRMHTLAKYIIELALLDYNMLRHLPSLQAAGACYLARRMLRSPPYWSATLEYYSGYSEADVLPVARELNTLVAYPNSKLPIIRKKYTSHKLGSVATVPPVSEPF